MPYKYQKGDEVPENKENRVIFHDDAYEEEFIDKTDIKPNPLEDQVGGNHYKDFPIQPFVFFFFNKLPFHKADIIKRIMRYDLPTGKGIEDLYKIKHELEMIIKLEEETSDVTLRTIFPGSKNPQC